MIDAVIHTAKPNLLKHQWGDLFDGIADRSPSVLIEKREREALRMYPSSYGGKKEIIVDCDKAIIRRMHNISESIKEIPIIVDANLLIRALNIKFHNGDSAGLFMKNYKQE